MERLFTLLKMFLRIDGRLLAIANLLQLLLENQQSLQHLPLQVTWLDNQDVMLKLKISESTLKRHRLAGVIRSTRIGGKYYYKESDIQNLLGQGML